MTIQAQRLLATACDLAEGPLQHTSGDLLWVDINRQQLFRWDRSGEPDIEYFDEPVSSIGETTDGELVVTLASGLWHLGKGGERRLVTPLPGASAELRMNDGKADPRGRFLAGTMRRNRPRDPVGSLWSFTGGRAVELVSGVGVSNGLAWTADRRTMYFVDTPTGRVDAFTYDPDAGTVADRRTVVEIPSENGKPDGMCIDDEGGLWVALWGGSGVHRYVDGELAEVVEVPTPYVTCPIFAAPSFDQLVITTASEPFESDAPAGAGDLYIADVGVTGPAPFLVDLEVVEGRSS